MKPPTIRNLQRSQRQEKSIAKDVGGQRVAGSGMLPSQKGDVRALAWLIEAKTTKAKSYTLKLATLVKIEKEAIIAKKHPALQVDLAGRRYVVLEYELFKLVAGALGLNVDTE